MTLELARKRRDQGDLIDELVEEMESICRQADDWCCSNDSGNAAMRFDDIADRLRILIAKAKSLDDCISWDDVKEVHG
jgi:hypothetical protein